MATAAANEQQFLQRLAGRGLEVKRMATDGNCLFRSVADRVYGDAEMHDVVRRLCMDHIQQSRDHFSQYLTEDFDAYVQRKRRVGVYGNHLEIQAISEIYNRPVHVYDVHGSADEPMNAFTASTEGEAGAPLRLSYHGRTCIAHWTPSTMCSPASPASTLSSECSLLSPCAPPLHPHPCPSKPSAGSHYNVIFDPLCADAGVGLGLPGLEAGGADRQQLEAAHAASEESALEAQLLCEVQSSSEREAASYQEAMLQAALRESMNELTGPSAAGGGASGLLYDDALEDALKTTATHGQGGGGGSSSNHGDVSSGGASSGATGNSADNEGHVVGESVQLLLSMGFSLPRAVQAHAMFGDDVESMLEYLTGDQ